MAIKIAGTEVINDDKELVLAKLAEVNASIADTAVDVFVYDTRKDSDGGAWRKRTQHTSWYNETLNTATRGSRKEFPAVAVIVAEVNKVTIYDGDDPSLPMWMVFNAGSFTNLIFSFNSLSAYNGVICSANNYGNINYAGLMVVRLLNDDLIGVRNSAYPNNHTSISGVVNRNSSWPQVGSRGLIISGGGLVSALANDVAMTVLPNAPIDPATQLPIPTIAVATDGGVSVIKDDGTVVDSASTIVEWVMFGGTDILYFEYSNSAKYIPISSITADGFSGYDMAESLVTTPIYAHGSVSSGRNAAVDRDTIAVGAESSAGSGLGIYHKGTDDTNYGTLASLGLDPEYRQAIITSTYNTGWMQGDIKGCWLSDTDDTDVTGTELVTNGDFATGDLTGWTDKSTGTGTATVNGSNQLELYRVSSDNVGWAQQAITTVSGSTYLLTVNELTNGGAIFIGSTDGGSDLHNAAAESGVNIVMFTATSTTTYIGLRGSDNGTTSVYDDVSVRLAEEDRSVNGNGLQVFGTVTKEPVAEGADLVGYSGFSSSNYLQQPYNSDLDFGTGDFCVMGWATASATATYSRYLLSRGDSSGYLLALLSDGTVYSKVAGWSGTGSNVQGQTFHIAKVRRNGIVYVYLNGKLDFSYSAVSDCDVANAPLTVGLLNTHAGTSQWLGSIALLRISATAPTAEQIARIYEDEKVLFQEGAQATLYGSSDAVTALAYDDTTDLLHVGTSAGRSDFSGLRRVSNTTDAVGTAISASNGLIVEE